MKLVHVEEMLSDSVDSTGSSPEMGQEESAVVLPEYMALKTKKIPHSSLLCPRGLKTALVYGEKMPPSMMSYNSKHSKYSVMRRGRKRMIRMMAVKAMDGGGSVMVIT